MYVRCLRDVGYGIIEGFIMWNEKFGGGTYLFLGDNERIRRCRGVGDGVWQAVCWHVEFESSLCGGRWNVGPGRFQIGVSTYLLL